MPASDESGARDMSLPPTNELRWEEFEAFTEAVLSAHRFATESGPRVTRVTRWGRPGDKQDGIDLAGEWSDGTTSSWQCKAYKRLQPAHVHRAVEECTFDADTHHLVYSGVASPAARQEILKNPGWTLVDRRDLNRLLGDVPLHRRREILDLTWDRATRKRLLRMPGADAFESVDALGATRMFLPVLNDAGVMVNRTAEIQALRSALEGDARIVLVSAPGGMGKTRLVVEVLRQLQDENPTVPILSLIPAHPLSDDSFDELPHSSAILFVDDGHERPDSVFRLLHYVLRNEHTKFVVATRKNGVTPLRDTFLKAGFPASGVATIELAPLGRQHAYELIDSLTEGLDVQLAYRTKLNIARLAEEAPYLGVLAIDAIRTGTLTGSLALSIDLRSAVLSSYRQSTTAAITEFQPALIERFLATCAATGGVIDMTNTDARAAMNMFCGLSYDESNRLVAALLRADVLTKTESVLRLVPDLLADMVLEAESVVEELAEASDFVPEVWRALYPLFGAQLLRRLTDLDWRLRRQNLPGVVGGIWQTLRDEIARTDMIGLHEAVQRLATLSYTQPRGLMPLLAEVRTRLAEIANVAEDAPPPRGPLTATYLERSERTSLRLRELTAADVENEMAPLFAQCARSEPDLLEQALDCLWGLHRSLAPLPALHPDSAAKAMDTLAEIGKLPDATVPQRVIDRVKVWLINFEPTPKAYPLFAIKPLLAKQGETVGQTARRIVSLNTYLVDADSVRPYRDAAREILVDCATGDQIGLAADAVRILKSALAPPHALHGFDPRPDDIASWESDDLATMSALSVVADTAASPVIRRLVRESVSWSAQYAKSLQIRCLAIEIATKLDNRGDELADALMGSHHLGLPDRHGQSVPTIADLTDDRDVGTCRPDDEDIVDYLDRERDAVLARCWTSLRRTGDIHDALDRVEGMAVEVALVDNSRHTLPFHFLGRYLAANYPSLCADTVRDIAARPPGPLDDLLVYALTGWNTADENELGEWLDASADYRDDVRSAMGDALNTNSWTDLGGPYLAAYAQGIQDPVPAVRANFHAASHRLLAQDAVDTVAALIAQDIERPTSTRLIESAGRFGRSDWIEVLDEPGVEAILSLARRADVGAHGVQGALAGIALRYPHEVLNVLLTCRREDGAELVDRCGDFPRAFGEQPEAVANWIVEQLPAGTTGIDDVLTAVTGEASYGGVADALAMQVADHTVDEIRGILEVFESLQYWPIYAPLLADQLIVRTNEVDRSYVDNVLMAITRACKVLMVSWVNGRSEELEHLLTLADTMSDADFLDTELRAVYRSAADEIRCEIEEIAMRHQNDYD